MNMMRWMERAMMRRDCVQEAPCTGARIILNVYIDIRYSIGYVHEVIELRSIRS